MAGALLSKQPGEALRNWLNDQDHPSHMPMRGLVKHFDDETTTESLVTWLGIDLLAKQTTGRITQAGRSPDQLPTLLKNSHRTLLPTIRKRLYRLDTKRPATVTSQQALNLDTESQRKLPAWLHTIAMPDRQRVDRLADGLSFTDPQARLASLRRLIELSESTPDTNIAVQSACNRVISSFCFDEKEPIARIALRHCLQQKMEHLRRLLQTLHRSPHASIRKLASDHYFAASFDDLWSLWDHTNQSATLARRLQAEPLLQTQDALIVEELRQRLISGDRKTRLQVIRIAIDLNRLADLELEILSQIENHDAYISATSISALGQLKSQSATQAVTAAINHTDARTRANAIESLPLISADESGPIIRSLKKTAITDENRPRANAVRALMLIEPKTSGEYLPRMLKDHRPAHRLSALWVVEETHPADCAGQLAHMIQNDPNEMVRARARRTARRLLTHMNTGQSIHIPTAEKRTAVA